jgi:hypothetical protein
MVQIDHIVVKSELQVLLTRNRMIKKNANNTSTLIATQLLLLGSCNGSHTVMTTHSTNSC